MYNKIIFFLLIILFVLPVRAQDYSRMVPYRVKNKWGFYDRYKKKITIQPKYDFVRAFSHGYAIYEVNNKKGIINRKGEEMTPPVFDKVYGYFDYKYIYDFAKEKTTSLLLIDVEKGDEYFQVDPTGKRYDLEQETIYEEEVSSDDNSSSFKHSYISRPQRSNWIIKKRKKYGITDPKKKNILVKPKYDSLVEVINAGGIPHKRFMAVKKKRWGMIDKNGNKILPFKYEALYETTINAFIAKQKGKYGMLENRSLRVLIPIEYDSVYPLNYDYFISEKNNLKALFSRKGEKVLPEKYIDFKVVPSFLYIQGANEKWGVADLKGKILVKPRFDDIKPFTYYNTHQYKKGKYFGLIHLQPSYKPVIVPAKYTKILPMKNKIFYVKTKNFKKGFIDIYGKEYFED